MNEPVRGEKIEIRELRPEEWPKILETGTLDVSMIPAPEASRCFGAIQEGQLVGYWFVQLAACCEPVWVHPEKRNGTLGFHLFNEMKDSLKSSVNGYLIHTDSAEVAGYLKRLGLSETGFMTFTGKV